MNTEKLGMIVRETWVKWAREQPVIREHWTDLWDQLSEPNKEVDRRIGAAIYAQAIQDAADLINDMRGQGENDLRAVKARIRGLADNW